MYSLMRGSAATMTSRTWRIAAWGGSFLSDSQPSTWDSLDIQASLTGRGSAPGAIPSSITTFADSTSVTDRRMWKAP